MWWDNTYPLRRNLQIIPPPVGGVANDPITFDFPAALNANAKIQPDGSDIEVLFLRNEMWLRLPRQIVWGYDDLPDKVIFPLVEDLTEPTEQYFVYHGNPAVAITSEQANFNEWHTRVEVGDPALTFTRPGEHWDDEGVSTTEDARATLQFYGDRVRLVADTGPDQGIFEVQVDDGSWGDISLYSVSEQPGVVVWEETDLMPGFHQVIVRVSGRQDPSSSSYNTNVKYFEYQKFFNIIDLGEEVDERVWTSVLGGS